MSILKLRAWNWAQSVQMHLLWLEGEQEAVLIDAPPNCHDEVSKHLDAEDLNLKEIWLTHGHWDHMAGAHNLNSEEIAVIGHRDDKIMFEQPSIMSGFAVPRLEMNRSK